MAVVNTLFETPETYVEWKIERFEDLPSENDFFLDSPAFFFSHVKWCLKLYPNLPEERCGVYLTKMESEGIYPVHLKMGYILNNGFETQQINYHHTFDGDNYKAGFDYITRLSIKRDRRGILSSDGAITLYCRVRSLNSIEVTQKIVSMEGIPTLAEDLKHLYLDRQYSDITFKVKNKELVAHKCILAARSKVFAAMFEHDMVEKCNETVKIDDSDPDSFEDFIIYLYTDKLDLVSSSNAISLFKNADKYDLPKLRKECVCIMIRNLTVESFCDVVYLAIMHGESDLLTAATVFFSKNLKAILKTSKWQGFLSENPTFGNELILKALDNI